MEGLRGNFGATDNYSAEESVEEDIGHEAPPPEIGKNERRMQVRAYNFWAALLDDRNFPNISNLDPNNMPDFGPNGVLLDFSKGIEDPSISFLGTSLATECGANGMAIERLSDVPTRSLLSRITDHYLQIIANQAPIGFEAEFVNQRGATILYRGILLPFSSDDTSIDYIFGVINWKELADQREADDLMSEIDLALDEATANTRRRVNDTPMADWADGPGALDDDAINEGGATATNDDLPRPSFGLDGDGESTADALELELDMAVAEPSAMGLADWLASAREMAEAARRSEDRTRNSLYDAISRAYDFAIAAADAPEDFTQIMEESGLTVQDRAPMTPVVKLVFGADYDKTRLTEYAAALSHAQRQELGIGELAGFLRGTEGGLKGVVQAERKFRRAKGGKPVQAETTGPRKSLAKKLRALEPRGFSHIANDGEEFGLVMIRRTEDGGVVMIGEVPCDTSLVERAARQILG